MEYQHKPLTREVLDQAKAVISANFKNVKMEEIGEEGSLKLIVTSDEPKGNDFLPFHNLRQKHNFRALMEPLGEGRSRLTLG